MTSPAEKSVDKRPHSVGFTIASMANISYRDLQYLAKICGVPCNLKKDILKLVIRAKKNGQHDEVEHILKQVRENRILKKKRKEQLNKAKAVVKTEVVEENNNVVTSQEGQEKSRNNKVKDFIRKMVKMNSTPAPNVTIQKTSTHTHYRALINPGTLKLNKCLKSYPSSTVTTQQEPEAAVLKPRPMRYGAMINAPFAADQGISYQQCCQANSSTACAPAPQLNYKKPAIGNNYSPVTAFSVRDTLLQQYHRNHACYESAQRVVDNRSCGGMCHRAGRGAAAYQPLPNPYFSLNNNNQVCNNNNVFTINQNTYSSRLQTGEMSYYQSTPMSSLHQTTQQYNRYGNFQFKSQRTSTLCNFDDSFARAQNADTQVPLPALTTYAASQPVFSDYNKNLFNDVPFENQVPGIPDKVPPCVIDVSKMSAGPENNVDTDLSLLANMALTKAQEVIDGTRSQQYNNDLLMINDTNNIPFGKTEPMTCDLKQPVEDIPTWNNFLELMSNNLSPGVTNKKALITCKYGCHIPIANRQEQEDHEQHCIKQTTQCPIVTCTFVGQLCAISTHILNDHKNNVTSNGSGIFFLDFTDGIHSFKNGPKKFCFPHMVNGRIFLINAIGDYIHNQVLIYVQYVNDHWGWKSQVACDVVHEQDEFPFQYTGEVYPLTHNPLHIISRRNCLSFSMDNNPQKNIYVLYTKIKNYKV